LRKLNSKKKKKKRLQITQLKMDNRFKQTFSKEDIKWSMGAWKNAQHDSSSGKCKSKPQRDSPSSIRRAVIQMEKVLLLVTMWRAGNATHSVGISMV
jgi:hypothetical protein